MVPLVRMENLQFCIGDVVANGVPGDLIETGVWRGGATIFMKAMLKSLNVTDKVVWVADSFQGLPKPDSEKYEDDKGDEHYVITELAIPLETVKNNFRKYGLLDDNV